LQQNASPDKYTHLQIDLVFTRGSTESLVYDILQPNVLHKGRLMFHLVRYSRHCSIFSQRELFTKLLKTLQQSTTSFALLGVHQAHSLSFRQTYIIIEPKLHEISEVHSFAYQFGHLKPNSISHSAGFQVSLSQNQICLQMSVFRKFRAIWFQVEHKVDGNWGHCAYLMSPKKGETGRGLSKNFQQPYE
ncbi:hypothetical protein CSKR_112273, partial [Clonorchis sinensis]